MTGLKAKDAVKRDEMEAFQKERQGLEVDVLDEVLSSRKVAWRTAGGMFVLTIAAFAITGLVIHRYSQPLPTHMMTYNDATHELQQVSLMEAKATYGEEWDKYWVSQFAIHRESYDFYSVQADYDAVGLMATADVAEEYQKLFSGPKGLDKVLGDTQNTRVKVSSVLLDREHGVATVRYTTTKKYRQRSLPEPPEYWIAVVAYTYDNILLTAEQRAINPLGFRVMSWRKNAEASSNVGG
jgi:type IV secretion system protein VirB8